MNAGVNQRKETVRMDLSCRVFTPCGISREKKKRCCNNGKDTLRRMVVKENKERMYAVDTALRGNLKKEKKRVEKKVSGE